MNKKIIHRYPGVKSFEGKDEILFKGREKAINALMDLIIVSKTVLFYSKSGLGKTSLLNAGLVPKLLKDNSYNLSPFIIKLGVNSVNAKVSPKDLLIKQIKNHAHSTSLDNYPTLSEYNTLFYLKSIQFVNPKTINVLIFDQFEDLFSYSPPEIDEFKKELNEILYSRTTKDFSDNLIKLNQSNPDIFSTEQLNRLSSNVNVRLVFAIRSDYLSSINRLTDLLPNLLNTYYELLPLSEGEAKDAIIEPAACLDNTFTCPPFAYEEEVILKIINVLTEKHTKPIETYQLQLVCRYAEDYIITNNPKDRTLKLQNLGDIEKIYSTYYETLINNISTQDADEKKRLRVLLEDKFVYQPDKRRMPVPIRMIEESISEKTFKELIESGLIKPSPYQTTPSYELYHDILVDPLHDSYKLRIAQEAELKRREEKTKKDKAKRRRWILFIISIAALISIAFAIFGFINKSIAESEKYTAERERDKATIERQNAENEKRNAEAAKNEAKNEQIIAESAKVTAELERNNAIESNKKALTARKLADSALTVANNILAQLYFYDDKIAVAVMKNPKNDEKLYGFIDKNGKTKIDFKYDEASLFNENTGYATVKRDRNLFLIDTTGRKEYLFCDDVNRIEHSVEAIDLRNSKLSEIPNAIFDLNSLSILLLSNNKIDLIPENISHLADSIFFLDLSDNYINKIPSQIGDLARLKVLNINSNSISFVPSEIGHLINLERLGLSRNKIEYLPPEIGQLTKLTKIDLYRNDLQSVPPEISNLNKISELNFSNNQLTIIPSELGQLSNLISLSVANNRLQSLPPEIGNLVNLQVLILSNNKLVELPIELGNLLRLNKIDFQKNLIEYLPNQIGKLTNIKEIDISNNSLFSLPGEIGNLINLTTANFRNNNIAFLPSEIGKLESLESLDISNNLLTGLPDEITKLKNLKTLNLRGNEIPEDIISHLQDLLPDCEILK